MNFQNQKSQKKIQSFIFTLFLFISLNSFSQKYSLDRIEPPNWWTGMKNRNLQLCVHGENIAYTEILISSKAVTLKKINKVENPNYLFLDLEIAADTQPETFEIQFNQNQKTIAKYSYELKSKTPHVHGFSTADNIYMLMPDRFANGNPANDTQPGMLEKANRKNPDGRHGGDIQGVINHLDYIQSLGMTAVWLNPTLENNMPDFSYHGYAVTDFYKTDARFGTNEDYKKFVDQCHQRKMKAIMDMVFNHCGSSHWWIKDLPDKSWLNKSADFQTNYRGEVSSDPHASQYDRERLTQGWFVSTMPDLNQHNSFLAQYLIQNSLWWIEFSGIDGIRMDTEPYPYLDFMATWAKRIHEEYPDFTLLGETWLQNVPAVAYFAGDSKISGDFNSGLNSVTDFPMFFSLKDAMNENDSWTGGLAKIYYTASQDFLYQNPNNNVIFLDNHDIDRFYTSVGENLEKFKMGIALLFTMRGIPVMQYGTEILITGAAGKGHGKMRKNFTGGWAEDKKNAFEQTGRTKEQNEAFDLIKKIANWRKNNEAVTKGKFLHFVPDNNVYVYFRYTENKAVMVILNNNDKESRTIDCARFAEILSKYKTGTDIISDTKFNTFDKITIPKKSAMIIDLN
jgi:glycosidase